MVVEESRGETMGSDDGCDCSLSLASSRVVEKWVSDNGSGGQGGLLLGALARWAVLSS